MTTAQLTRHYQQPLWGTLDRVSRNCMIAAAIAGTIVIILVFVVPKPVLRDVTIQEMPERFARLILEKPKPAPVIKTPVPSTTYEAPSQEVAKAEQPKPVKPKTRPVQRQQAPKVAQNKGQQGRQKAQVEVAQNLAAVSGSLDKVLKDISQALPASSSADQSRPKSKRRQRRGVRSGRTSVQLAAVNNLTDMAQADIQGSSIANTGISIAGVTDLEIDGTASSGGGLTGGSGGNSAGGGGELRSSESLLTVVRRYAPGIQFCYENELKKSPGLGGKMVVSLTVEPDGTVSSVILVEDSLRSAAVSDCVTAQMRGWKFPAIETGTVTFKTPFVFTPPD
jgi:TonB family protein